MYRSTSVSRSHWQHWQHGSYSSAGEEIPTEFGILLQNRILPLLLTLKRETGCCHLYVSAGWWRCFVHAGLIPELTGSFHCASWSFEVCHSFDGTSLLVAWTCRTVCPHVDLNTGFFLIEEAILSFILLFFIFILIFSGSGSHQSELKTGGEKK